MDPVSGKTYFLNHATRETTWTGERESSFDLESASKPSCRLHGQPRAIVPLPSPPPSRPVPSTGPRHGDARRSRPPAAAVPIYRLIILSPPRCLSTSTPADPRKPSEQQHLLSHPKPGGNWWNPMSMGDRMRPAAPIRGGLAAWQDYGHVASNEHQHSSTYQGATTSGRGGSGSGHASTTHGGTSGRGSDHTSTASGGTSGRDGGGGWGGLFGGGGGGGHSSTAHGGTTGRGGSHGWGGGGGGHSSSASGGTSGR